MTIAAGVSLTAQLAQIFKRALDETYHLKMKASRDLFSQINRKAPALPFNLRQLEGRGLKLVQL